MEVALFEYNPPYRLRLSRPFPEVREHESTVSQSQAIFKHSEVQCPISRFRQLFDVLFRAPDVLLLCCKPLNLGRYSKHAKQIQSDERCPPMGSVGHAGTAMQGWLVEQTGSFSANRRTGARN